MIIGIAAGRERPLADGRTRELKRIDSTAANGIVRTVVWEDDGTPPSPTRCVMAPLAPGRPHPTQGELLLPIATADIFVLCAADPARNRRTVLAKGPTAD